MHRDDPRRPVPASWSDAFARLPAEDAPDGGWARLAATLDALPASPRRPPVRRRRIATALAASVVFAACATWWLRSPSPTTDATRASAPAATASGASSGPANVATGTAAAPATAEPPAQSRAATTVRIAVAPPGSSRPAAGPGPVATRATPGGDRRPVRAATAEAPVADAPVVDSAFAVVPDETTAAVLARLQAESGQLEALLALTHDDRVESAAAALLSDDLDARIGLVDAALAQPQLPDARRVALWRQRVSMLRDRAGVESTERWLAANGTTPGDALVRVD